MIILKELQGELQTGHSLGASGVEIKTVVKVIVKTKV